LVCTDAPVCPFSITLRKLNEGDVFWGVTSAELDHLNCTAESKPSVRQVAEFESTRSAIAGSRNISAAALGRVVQAQTGEELRRHTLYRARNIVNGELGTVALENYQLIGPYLDAFTSNASGTVTALERDGVGRFRRAFVMPSSQQVVLHSPRIFGVDATFMKNPGYNGQLLLLIGRDGKRRNYVVAFALVPKENLDNYEWFFRHVKAGESMEAILNDSKTVIFSDRDKGLASAVQAELPAANHLVCFAHLLRNLKANPRVPNLGPNVKLAWDMQKATSEVEYAAALQALAAVNAGAANYLCESDPNKWCVYHNNLRGTIMHGCSTSNFVESENAKIMQLRNRLPFDCIAGMCENIAAERYGRHVEALELQTKGQLISPKVVDIYEEQVRLAGAYAVRMTAPHVGIVTAARGETAPRQRRVDLLARSCTCSFWQQRGIPCRHAIKLHREWRGQGPRPLDGTAWFSEGFAPCLAVSAVVKAYSMSIDVPLREELQADGVTLPAPKVATAGRPKQKRVRSAGEGEAGRAGRPKRMFQCGTCGNIGHNSRSC
ncbi:unnamed protein product, partial [Phaeothamnion confervicola]